MITKTHQHFFLSASSWPLAASLASFNLFFSILILFKGSDLASLSAALFLSTSCGFLWWMGYEKEFSLSGSGTMDLEKGLKCSMILFISSEVLFFFSFFWSYFHFFLNPTLEGGLMWPSVEIIPFESFNVPFLNTLILLSSGVTVTIAHSYNMSGGKKPFNTYLMVTVMLGVIFTFFQSQEYKESFFSMSDGSFGTTFFMLTGFHGVHVLIGTIFLLISLAFSLGLTAGNSNFVSFELASWYWHFVDVVWIFLFFFLYYING